MATTSDAVSTALRLQGLMGGGLQDPPMTLQSGVLGSSPQIMAGIHSSAPTKTNALNGSSRLYTLLSKLEKLISEKYAFDVFAKNSINFGIMVTYRQTWVPLNYQVGDLVSTIPLAPKEIRRYTTRTVIKKARSQNELEDNLQTLKTESRDTSRVDSEIVQKARDKTNFDVSAKETFGGKGYTIDSTQKAGGEQAKESEQTKKDFRESVLTSAQEYKQQHRLEINSDESQETENTTFHEIQNPNDELTVTYLFYELQRTYEISEKIHQLTPVILVANDVPAPDEIDDAWLVAHDWILRRVILDDSFRPALEYLTKSFVGAETNIRILEDNAIGQKQIVDSLNQQILVEEQILATDQQDVLNAVLNLGASQQQQGLFNIVKRIFDPIGITGQQDTGAVSAAQVMVDYAEQTRDRAERERARLLSQLQVAITALQAAVNKLSSAVKEHYDKVAEIDRLRVHVKDNILYYMQAIWSYEPPDQRFFRLYNIDVPIVKVDPTGVNVGIYQGGSFPTAFDYWAEIPKPQKFDLEIKKLVEVADLDNLLGYKGNYMIFPLNENNYITLHMMQDYLQVGDEVVVADPDEFGNYTLDEIHELACCVYRKDPNSFKRQLPKFKQLIIDRLMSSRKESDLVIVPTKSLYIEALVGTHPLLEDFKLIHRAEDAKKVQAEVRHAELENIRLAARLLKGENEDPDIEKKIVIETDTSKLTVQPDGN
jgi:hypothetical protein